MRSLMMFDVWLVLNHHWVWFIIIADIIPSRCAEINQKVLFTMWHCGT